METLQSWGIPRPGYNTLAGRPGTAAGRRSRPETFAVQAFVEVGDVLAVTVEQERRPSLAGADDLFTRLAPARMRHLRIHIGPEAIFRRLQCFPHSLRTLVGETETHDRLDRLETVLPRQGEPQRRAVLPRERVPIGAGDEKSEFVGRFCHRHAFDIG